MDKVFTILDHDIQIINDTLPISNEISADNASKDLFKLVDLITDFFINFQLSEPQNIKLFALFLPIQVQCFSVFNSQGIFCDYEFSHFWTLFSKEFLKTTGNLVKYDFQNYAFQMNDIIIPFLQTKNVNENINCFISQVMPHFTSLLAEMSKNIVNSSFITQVLNEFDKMKMRYFNIIDSLNQYGSNIIVPQAHINLFLEIDYSLCFYNQLIKVREAIKQLSEYYFYS